MVNIIPISPIDYGEINSANDFYSNKKRLARDDGIPGYSKRFRNHLDNTDISEGSISVDSLSEDEGSLVGSVSTFSTKIQMPRKWTNEEDSALREAVSAFGELKWQKIAAHVGTRDHGKIRVINSKRVFY
jgi:hypothetical protein